MPEQLVVLDPGLAAVDENYVRILQRYKVLTVSRSSNLEIATFLEEVFKMFFMSFVCRFLRAKIKFVYLSSRNIPESIRQP